MSAAQTSWMGVPVERPAADLIALGEIILATRPDVVIEVGLDRGGALLYEAGILDQLGRGRIVGVGTDPGGVDERVRAHPRIELLEGDPVDPAVSSRLWAAVGQDRAMAVVSSAPGADRRLEELRVVGPMVAAGCYLVALRAAVDGGASHELPDRPGEDALVSWLADGPPFAADPADPRVRLTSDPSAYLRRREGEPGRAPGSAGDAIDDSSARWAPRADAPAPPQRDREEIESLRLTVRSLAERNRRLADPEPAIRRRLAPANERIRRLERELESRIGLAAEKDRLLEIERARWRRLRDLWPLRVLLDRRRRKGPERVRELELGPGSAADRPELEPELPELEP